MKDFKHKFKTMNNARGKALVCPECFEMVTQADIETYPSCPYCDCSLEQNTELEDYILQPVVDHWVKQCGRKNSAEIFVNRIDF